jgi:hypothetical protein
MNIQQTINAPINTDSTQFIYDEINKIHKVAAAFPWTNKEAYTLWLAQTFHYVARTTRLIAQAASRMSLEQHRFYSRCIHEIKEEDGHELLVLHDLKAMNHSLSDFNEIPEAAFFYQTLSYLIDRENPLCILGYSLALEGVSALKGGEYYEAAKSAFGPSAVTFLKVHSELDAHHFSEGVSFLKECDAKDLEPIKKGARQCSVIYRNILNSCAEAALSAGRA